MKNDINFLKNSLDDRISNSKIKMEALGKSASTNNTAKKGRLPIKERCADSSRVCTFFYPDHADAIIRTTNNSFPYNKTIQQVLNSKDTISSSVAGREALTGRCSDSSRFCTFYYPDHPDAIIKVTNNGSSHNKKPISLNHPPRSCKELKGFGHALNGFYLVQGTLEQANKVLTIYCNFIDENNSKF